MDCTTRSAISVTTGLGRLRGYNASGGTATGFPLPDRLLQARGFSVMEACCSDRPCMSNMMHAMHLEMQTLLACVCAGRDLPRRIAWQERSDQ